MKSFQRRKSRNTVTLAGWLLADLLLGIAMLFFVLNTQAAPGVLDSTLTFTPSPSSTISPTEVDNTPTMTKIPTATVTMIPEPGSTPRPGLAPESITIKIFVNPENFRGGEANELSSAITQIKEKFEEFLGERAGLVITEGYDENINTGFQIATIANDLLVATYPQIFRDAITKAYWFSPNEINKAGTIEFEVYLYTWIEN